ncbi:hypothetical protein NPIL_468051 [Nephila pilipes]|uniref:Uncharacterized protein n=1 Tax=Nephila pilipes TaxID=299642 RepID=A0A8X6NYB5_NEPPI|nr:hypothetical protein NPIL_468051 [Nephila pilipes]
MQDSRDFGHKDRSISMWKSPVHQERSENVIWSAWCIKVEGKMLEHGLVMTGDKSIAHQKLSKDIYYSMALEVGSSGCVELRLACLCMIIITRVSRYSHDENTSDRSFEQAWFGS